MRAFLVMWIGQTISLLGSGMSWFAFSLWAWDVTGSATAWALVQFCVYAPGVLFSPLAGVLVDRWNRKAVLLVSDGVTALGTLSILILHSLGMLQIWHLYAIGLTAGICTACQVPAYTATVTLLLPKEHYARAGGMQMASQSIRGILAPLLAAALLGPIGMQGILTIDLITFFAALGTLACVRIPQVPRRLVTEVRSRAAGLWRRTMYGFRYIAARPSLSGLVLLFVGGDFFQGLSTAVVTPMLLARSGGSEMLLGQVQSVGAVGGVIGGVVLSIWGGPKRRMHGVLLGWVCANVLGLSLMGLSANFAGWALASFCFAFFTPIADGLYTALWQVKVAPQDQGRVLANQNLLVSIPALVGTLLAGPLADDLLAPALNAGGVLAGMGSALGGGPGLGMALLMILAGLASAMFGLVGYAIPAVYHLEDLLPDYDTQAQLGTDAGEDPRDA